MTIEISGYFSNNPLKSWGRKPGVQCLKSWHRGGRGLWGGKNFAVAAFKTPVGCLLNGIFPPWLIGVSSSTRGCHRYQLINHAWWLREVGINYELEMIRIHWESLHGAVWWNGGWENTQMDHPIPELVDGMILILEDGVRIKTQEE